MDDVHFSYNDSYSIYNVHMLHLVFLVDMDCRTYNMNPQYVHCTAHAAYSVYSVDMVCSVRMIYAVGVVGNVGIP